MSDHDCTIRELVGTTAAVPAGELDPVLTDPDTGQRLHPQRASAPESVETAVATAWAAHAGGVWSDLPRGERAAALRRLHTELASRTEELARADSLDTGVPRATTAALIGAVAQLLDLGATQIEDGFEHTEQLSSAGACDQWRLPWGPAAVFIPWNAPSHLAIVKTSYALVAGCPVIVKPSEWAPHFSGVFADAVRAALPPGVVQIVHGDRTVGEAIVGDERIAAVSYTGGVAGGMAVAEACGRLLKPVDLELSGNNPVVVLPGEEPKAVVEQVVTAMLTLNGQYCIGPRRLIVPEAEVEDYLAALGPVLDAVRIGRTTDPDAQLGPLSHEPHRRRIDDQLAEFAARGCEVRRYGRLPDASGHFVAPAVVLTDPAPELREEIFGPVLQVRTYRELDDAITTANDHPYGLGGYVFGTDREAARAVGRRLRAGLVRLNSAYGPPDADPVASMWGVSGLGELGTWQGPAFFTGARFVG
ncbi:aldehyde dehydrogenase family protein [Jiangella alkaliphila]|uniref:Acyl-CoA reductase n=1 Tax=Jiangella alkaliphila TaxID=419479 RepID=A0A1H2ISD7_9ACTN|nr:aldehyde dehydrogenase family protein [Jiangella alkaliphila]SDU47049.1 Acyl-CoA reductase [Jiangella alkaliphila]